MSLFGYYKLNFQLMQHHKYSLTEIEMMIPWEKEIYVTQLVSFIKEQNDRIKERNMKKGLK
jgi:hypothetical protein